MEHWISRAVHGTSSTTTTSSTASSSSSSTRSGGSGAAAGRLADVLAQHVHISSQHHLRHHRHHHHHRHQKTGEVLNTFSTSVTELHLGTFSSYKAGCLNPYLQHLSHMLRIFSVSKLFWKSSDIFSYFIVSYNDTKTYLGLNKLLIHTIQIRICTRICSQVGSRFSIQGKPSKGNQTLIPKLHFS